MRGLRPTGPFIERRDVPGILLSIVLVLVVGAVLLWGPRKVIQPNLLGPDWECYPVYQSNFCIRSIYPQEHFEHGDPAGPAAEKKAVSPARSFGLYDGLMALTAVIVLALIVRGFWLSWRIKPIDRPDNRPY